MPRGLKYIFYVGLFIFSFIFLTYWMFPMDAVKGRIIGSIEKALGPGYVVQIEDIGTYWFSGARLKNLKISHLKQGKEDKVLEAERMTARAGLFSLLFGGPRISFDLRMGKMEVEGSLHNSDQGWELVCSLYNVDVSQIPLFQQKIGLQLSSSVDGDIRINYDAKQPLRTTGEIELTFDKLFLKGGDLPLGEMGTFPLPDLSLADKGSQIKGAIDRGAINLESLRFKGEDLNLDLSGKIFLSPTLDRYRMNLQGKIQFSPKVWKSVDPILPEKWLVELRKQKTPDDTFPLSISGQFSAPQVYSGTMPVVPFKPF
ncbi:MAG: type II secretion system protein GspN [Deltaproteobacteria bacterium]|nr:type II secretion system protein GspN [Deltaproteobacteria bacterium]